MSIFKWFGYKFDKMCFVNDPVVSAMHNETDRVLKSQAMRPVQISSEKRMPFAKTGWFDISVYLAVDQRLVFVVWDKYKNKFTIRRMAIPYRYLRLLQSDPAYANYENRVGDEKRWDSNEAMLQCNNPILDRIIQDIECSGDTSSFLNSPSILMGFILIIF